MPETTINSNPVSGPATDPEAELGSLDAPVADPEALAAVWSESAHAGRSTCSDPDPAPPGTDPVPAPGTTTSPDPTPQDPGTSTGGPAAAPDNLVFDPYQISYDEQMELKGLIERTGVNGRIAPRPGRAETSEMLVERRDELLKKCMVTSDELEHDREIRMQSPFGPRAAPEFPSASEIVSRVYRLAQTGETADGMQTIYRPETGKTYLIPQDQSNTPYVPVGNNPSLQRRIIDAQRRVDEALAALTGGREFNETTIMYLEKNHQALEKALDGKEYEGFDEPGMWESVKKIFGASEASNVMEKRTELLKKLGEVVIPGKRIRELDIALYKAMRDRDALFKELEVIKSDAGPVARYLQTEVTMPVQAAITDLAQENSAVYNGIAKRDQTFKDHGFSPDSTLTGSEIREAIKKQFAGASNQPVRDALLKAQGGAEQILQDTAGSRFILPETVTALMQNNAAVQEIYEKYVKANPGTTKDFTEVLKESDQGLKLLAERELLLNQLTGRRDLIALADNGSYYQLDPRKQKIMAEVGAASDVESMRTLLGISDAARQEEITGATNTRLANKPDEFALYFSAPATQ